MQLFFHGIVCGKPVDNSGPNVGINLTSQDAVNSLVVHDNVMFVTRQRLGKQAGFYPHCKNYQFDEITYF